MKKSVYWIAGLIGSGLLFVGCAAAPQSILPDVAEKTEATTPAEKPETSPAPDDTLEGLADGLDEELEELELETYFGEFSEKDFGVE